MKYLPSGLPELIGDDEPLVRFLLSSSHFSVDRVKPAAFLPSPNANETSMSRHGPQPVTELWKLGAAAAGQRTLHGAAFVKAADVTNCKPLIVIADEPPVRHAAIRNWPIVADDPDLTKARQKELAIQLASSAGQPLKRSNQKD